MKSKKRRRSFKIKTKVLEGVSLEVPDNIAQPTKSIEDDSIVVLVCPKCGTRRYATQAFLDFIQEAKGVHASIEQILPRHKPCNFIMNVHRLERVPVVDI